MMAKFVLIVSRHHFRVRTITPITRSSAPAAMPPTKIGWSYQAVDVAGVAEIVGVTTDGELVARLDWFPDTYGATSADILPAALRASLIQEPRPAM